MSKGTAEATGRGRLHGRSIGLGITGSIAAYKAIELLRLLQAEGADVRVLLTPSATRFVAPLTLEALSRHPVDLDVLELQPDGRIGHIESAGEADAVVVAPATAHWLGAMANGLASDPITAACLATSAPVVVAPAMDGGMYAHPATQANVARLRSFGYRIVEPELGPLASGQVGVGRLAALPSIVEAVVEAVGEAVADGEPERGRAGDLAGRHLVVTAGGTAEPIDPVRFVGNRSSGKMGTAIAEAALARGAQVTVLAGHVSVALPQGARIVTTETAAAMGEALAVALGPGPRPGFDALVMAAAVADFRPRDPSSTKLSRDTALTLELEPTQDLLAEIGRRARALTEEAGPEGKASQPVLVGFAAETGSLDRVPEKLRRKGLDLLVANDVAEPGSGFGTDTDRVTLYRPDAPPEPWPLLSKREVADRLLDRVVGLLAARVEPSGVPTRPTQEVTS